MVLALLNLEETFLKLLCIVQLVLKLDYSRVYVHRLSKLDRII